MVVKRISGQLDGIGCYRETSQRIDETDGADDCTFSKMAPFTCSEMNRIDHENLGPGSTGQLADGIIENVFAALYGAIQRKSWFYGRTRRRRVRGTVLCLGMKGDVQVGESLIEELRWGQRGRVRKGIGEP